MFASTRWRPHSGVGEARYTGAPLRASMCSTWALPDEQRAVYAFGIWTQGVAALGSFTPVIEIAAAIVVPGANGALGLIGVIAAEPPPSAAGLVHSTSRPAAPVRPNSAPSGTGSLNVENATTQPVWRLSRQARTCLKSPPTSLPFFTVTFPPSRIAETSLRRTLGFLSIWFATRRRSTKVPCEWPTRITPRPLLYLRR